MIRRLLLGACCLLGPAAPGEPGGPARELAPFDPRSADFDELLVHVQRYATTPAKQQRKQAAYDELHARGTGTLHWLVQHAHITNLYVQILMEQLVDKVPTAEGAPVLLEGLGSEHVQTRKLTAFFLGFYDTPQYAGAVMPLLDDEEAGGAAARTLGKWKAREAVPGLLPFLTHEKERRRVLAVNALRDIGDPRAVPHLMAALQDPVFTVRKAAARALAGLGRESEAALLEALPGVQGTAGREVIGAIGRMRPLEAIDPLRELLKHDDSLVREDAARALYAIDPNLADLWLEEAGIDRQRLVLPEAQTRSH
ncbi:MAG: HEAT repeat domain-containing protein [Kiritimatiellae bacterium]|nr:HEAT repeat domain-containing protein [Kiritimatiellia bacterium]